MNPKNDITRLLSLVPKNNESVDWNGIFDTGFGIYLSKMADTPQNPEYHGEGDVLSHTKAVCNALIQLDEYKTASEEDKEILFLSALFHDVGKIRCTKTEDGQIVSPHHSAVGGVMTREILWRIFGLCGSEEKRALREAVSFLVRYHSYPPFAMKDENAPYKLLKISSNGLLAKGFSLDKLCILEKADVLGRISKGKDDYLERIAYCKLLSEDTGCLHSPYPFPDAYSKRAYFRKQTSRPEQQLYNSSWGEIILMSGLPGTGKSTWIENNCPHLPIVSLDDIRKKLGISPTDKQGPVVAAAHEKAREYLRKKQPFVWDATSITYDLRSKQISLFEQYGASVKAVFLETDFDEEIKRNAQRKDSVPVPVIEKMLSRLEIPEAFECESVTWNIT